MPELPEVETTKNSLLPLVGYKVTGVKVFQPKLRWSVPNDLNKLEGYRLVSIQRRAKYLILTFSVEVEDIELNTKPILMTPQSTTPQSTTPQSTTPQSTTPQSTAPQSTAPESKALESKTPVKQDGVDTKSLSIIIHLGMSGSLQQYPLHTKKRKHDHLIFTLKHSHPSNIINSTTNPDGFVGHNDTVQLHYHDPRRFGAVLWHHDYAQKLFNHLGLEPLDNKFTAEYLYNKIHRLTSEGDLHKNHKKSKKPYARPIKSIIMDQAFVVGVGNIYATESLFLSGVHPETPANTLSTDKIQTLVHHIKLILKQSIQQGGSTLRDFTVASGTTGYFQQTLNVYGKHNEPCPTCATPIDKVIINGRASTFCPTCQKIK